MTKSFGVALALNTILIKNFLISIASVWYRSDYPLYNTAGCDHPVLRDLVNHVVPSVANHWYDLGLQLLDPKYANELDIIEADTKNDAKTCCRKMFSKWLKTDELARWDKLIEALALTGLNNVASNIKRLIGQG